METIYKLSDEPNDELENTLQLWIESRFEKYFHMYMEYDLCEPNPTHVYMTLHINKQSFMVENQVMLRAVEKYIRKNSTKKFIISKQSLLKMTVSLIN